MFTEATINKRQQLIDFVDRILKPEPNLCAVVGVGSIAFGTMRPNSDIDAVLFWNPVDRYVVPSEFVWIPETNTYHSIFAPNVTGIQFDLHHFDLREWSDPHFIWSEGQRAAFVDSWLVYDRHGTVARLFEERTAYTEETRQKYLDSALLDMQMIGNDPIELWESLGPIMALDRTQSTYEALVRGLFAYNWRWRPWRIREMSYLLSLSWLPTDFETRVLTALNGPSLDLVGFCQRFATIRDMGNELLVQLGCESDYGSDPIGNAFIRSHDLPGYAHNMDEWNKEHLEKGRKIKI